MILPPPDYPFIPGEVPGDRIARILRLYNGCSIHNRASDLAALVGRGVEDQAFVKVATNCATFALGLLSAAGVKHKLLQSTPYKGGEAFAWVVQIGDDFGAWRKPVAQVPRGGFIWYSIAGENDDHVEVALDPPDEHGGGGRPDNAITIGHGDERFSWTRPVHLWLDPESLGIEFVPLPVTPDPHA